jgi:di/tripeptidase
MQRDLNLLKSVLSVPTKTYDENKMIEFISNWLTTNSIPFWVDQYGNIYVTKDDGIEKNNYYYPCVVSHTDTVHDIDIINVVEMELMNYQNKPKLGLKAFNDQGNPTGIGGDDKCGVFACMELLKELPNLKAAFFVSEETGCHGSKKADPEFFNNVGFVIQFDAPYNWMVTEYCMGVKLFDKNSEFFKGCDVVLNEVFEGRQKYQSHPYTDVYALKKTFDFSCINFSIGYYNMHSREEYVIIEDVLSGIEAGKKIIESLGGKKYSFSETPQYSIF